MEFAVKCRAKMCDGSPVTFDCEDHGVVPLDGLRDCHLTTFIGDGFFVRSEYRSIWDDRFGSDAEHRAHVDRLALERSGVDTATVERWEITPVCGQNGEAFPCGRWVPVFPGIKITHTEDFEYPTEIDSPEVALAKNINIVRKHIAVTDIVRNAVTTGHPSSGLDRALRDVCRAAEARLTATPEMVNAGTAALQDRLVKFATLQEGKIGFSGGLGLTVLAIWNAMEKARR